MTKLKLLFLLLLTSSLSFGQKTDIRLNGLDTEIENLLKAYNAVGLSIAIVENNKTIYSKGYGFRDFENKLPTTANTIFPIGSITKSFTASLLGKLESENKLSLKDKPSFYLPKLQFYNTQMDNLITIEDLLSHKSGIGSVDGTYILFPAKERPQLMEKLKYLKPNGAIKDSWIYSNFGYIIAGTITEKITNQTWDENIKEKLFLPLKMNNSSTSTTDMFKNNDYSFGYGIINNKSEKVLFAELNNDKPGGAINSSANDMANWMLVWLNNGQFNNQQILPTNYIQEAESYKAMDNGLPPESSDPNVYTFGYGYGWKINSNKGHYKVHHGGNLSGFSSQLALYPTDKLGIIVLTNQHNSILPYIVSDIIANRMLKLPKTEWNKYPVKVTDISIVSKEIKSINLDKKPTHNLNDYCGKFSNLGFGTFEIINENNKLFAVFPDFKFQLEHQYYDIFVLKATKEIPQIMNPEFYLNFSLDYDGNVSSVKINLQNEPVEFIKQTKE
ncbi:serine hydrolase [Flavobacterium frigoris]|uniref:CubicO group peptidase, beta-lactamase class C family n=1 Tax=Flavobacterium frigoris TaxID=229204 RepID=A0A1H9RY39_FLAFI|nr:serine hydrolase [Flavobacterium frigoris]SER77681.1 CubicO group peptidase, beta-lactamase class C family [Flavobacterium frigoris]